MTNPITVVSCVSAGDTTCMVNTCQAGTGQCVMTPTVALMPDVCADDTDCGVPGAICDGTCQLPCDDGNACSIADACDDTGACVAQPWAWADYESGANPCQCVSNAGCMAHVEDGDLCNGTPYCNQAQHSCVINPTTVVSCPSGGDTACARNTCVPETGQCETKAKAWDVVAQVCVSDEACRLVKCVGNPLAASPVGTCAAGELPGFEIQGACDDGTCAYPPTCNDGDICTTTDRCDGTTCGAIPWTSEQHAQGWSACECKADSDCPDDDLCDGTQFCELATGTCQNNPATAVTCGPLDAPCATNTCDPQTGLCEPVPTAGLACAADADCPEGVPCAGGKCAPTCSDDQACTSGDQCLGFACLGDFAACGPDADDAYEPNDTEQTAEHLPRWVLDDGLVARDDDWFEVTICAGGVLTAQIAFAHAVGDLDLEGGGEVSQGTTDAELISVPNPGAVPVNVTFRVYGYSGAENTYSLSVSVDGC
jgi:hypothetical protein